MGLFSKARDFTFTNPSTIAVPDWVHDELTDPGDILRDIYADTDSTVQAQVEAELQRVSYPQGGYDLRSISDKKHGPLYLLSWITAGDWITLGVWARHDLRGARRKDMENRVQEISRAQGLPAAAAWAVGTWSSVDEPGPSVPVLSGMLNDIYYEHRGTIRNSMVIDSVKKWKR